MQVTDSVKILIRNAVDRGLEAAIESVLFREALGLSDSDDYKEAIDRAIAVRQTILDHYKVRSTN